MIFLFVFFFFSSRRRHTRCGRDWSSDVCSSDLPLLRVPAGRVGMDRADRWIGLSDGGSGLEDRLRENFPRVEVVILDFFHPAEKLTGLARLLCPEDEGRADDQARRWRQLLKDEGGAVLAAVLSE